MRGIWILLLLCAPAAAEGLVEAWDKPKRASFEIEKRPLHAVVDAIRKRLGVTVPVKVPDATVDFEAKDVTFLEALDRLARENGLAVTGAPVMPKDSYGADERPLVLVRAAKLATPLVYIGPSRLAIRQIAVQRVARFAPPDEMSRGERPGVTITMHWMVPEGLESAAVIGLAVDTVLDDRDGTMNRLPARTTPFLPMPANHTFDLAFELGAAGATRARKLAGTLTIALPLERTHVEFERGEKGASKPLGDARIELHELSVDPPALEFTVHGRPCKGLAHLLDFPGPEVQLGGQKYGAQRHRIWDLDVLALPEDGPPIQSGRETSDTIEGTTSWRHRSALQEPAHRILITAVTEIELREVRFEFRDLPLPR